MLYPPKACFMFSTVQGTTFMNQEFSSCKMFEVQSQNYLAFDCHYVVALWMKHRFGVCYDNLSVSY